jgi:glutamine amidotransferase
MCELLALCFNGKVRPSLSFQGFCHRGRRNPHGWGIARFDKKVCQVFKEPLQAEESRLSEFVRSYEHFRSKIFIAHVRYASCGEHNLQNTHPFVRTFRSREVAFAHNGTLRAPSLNTAKKFYPVGETDSEQAFCLLLDEMSANSIQFDNFAGIEEILHRLNAFGNMNLVFSEGEHLYVYRDKNGYNGLCAVKRRCPFPEVSLVDEDWRVDLRAEKNENIRDFVIATKPISDEEWFDLKAGGLTVFRNGELLYGEAGRYPR